MPTVLAILTEGFEEIEFVAPVDILRRAGIDVTVAAMADSIQVKGRSGITIHADTLLADVADKPFDALFLPGGPGVKLMRADSRVRSVVTAFAKNGKWLAAICAAPAVLHDAGLLSGRRYTAHPSVAGELTHILSSMRVVVDGKIITSRGAGTAFDFGLSLVEHLISPAKAREIASGTCA